MPIIVNGKKTNEIHFKYGAYVDFNEPVPTLKYGTRPGTVVVRKKAFTGTGEQAFQGYSDFDNNSGGSWKYYFHIPITSSIQEDTCCRIEFTPTHIEVWAQDNSQILASGSIANFWTESNGIDIRVFDENYMQDYFWLERYDPQNKRATLWVKLRAYQRALNIAYGNDSCMNSDYHNREMVFVNIVDGLYGFWEFGNYTTQDLSGHNRTVTVYGDVTWHDETVELDGQDDCMKIYLGNLNTFTILLRMRFTVDPTTRNVGKNWQYVLWSGWNYEIGHYGTSTNHSLKVKIQDDKGSRPLISIECADTNFHVWAYRVHSKNFIRIDLCDTEQYSEKEISYETYDIGDLWIASRPGYAYKTPMEIDYLMVFDRILSDTEIQNIYRYGGIAYNNKLYVGCRYQNLSFGTVKVRRF